MKNIMVFDDGQDYFYDIYSVSEDDFLCIFPGKWQNVEFHDDLYKRPGSAKLDSAFKHMWYGRRDPKRIDGLHGMLFYENFDRKPFYPDKRDFAGAMVNVHGHIATQKTIIIVEKEPSRPILACQISEKSFDKVFSLPRQDVAFFEDLEDNFDLHERSLILGEMKQHVISKDTVLGIDGTLYIGYPERRKYFVNRIEAEIPRHYPLSE